MKPAKAKHPKHAKRKARKATDAPASLRLWTPAERNIYRYHDGQRERLGDPLELHGAIVTAPDIDWETDVKLMLADQTDDPGILKLSAQARQRVVAAIRHAFGVQRLEVGGLPAADCIALFMDFLAWIGEVKKKSGISVTGATPTGSPPSCPPADLITQPTADCNSTSSASFTDALTSSPPASPPL